jgi:hypothetical protein
VAPRAVGPPAFHGAQERPQPRHVGLGRPEALRALQQHGGGPQHPGALQRPLPRPHDGRGRPERTDLSPVLLRERLLQPPVGRAGRLVGDHLPGLDGELEAGWHVGPPAPQQRVGRWFVERVLHLDQREAPHVGGHRRRPPAQPDPHPVTGGRRPLARQRLAHHRADARGRAGQPRQRGTHRTQAPGVDALVPSRRCGTSGSVPPAQDAQDGGGAPLPHVPPAERAARGPPPWPVPMNEDGPHRGADPDLAAVTARLLAAGCVAAAAEAASFLAAAPDRRTLDSWLVRREQGEPPAWITGTTTFCGRTLHVSPGVYVPRAQTEELARRAASVLPPGGRALDLCTGTGAVAAHLRARVPTAAVIGGRSRRHGGRMCPPQRRPRAGGRPRRAPASWTALRRGDGRGALRAER